jgi:vitamin B12 transporter
MGAPAALLAFLPALLAVLPALLPAPCAAQDSTSLAPVVVTAARTEQPLAETLPSVTVITRADIELEQARDLVELLGRQTGLEFARNGGQGAQSSLFVRGTNSNQVLVLVDGAPINSVALGAADLGGLATGDIERIEIVRGNLSSLYGADAIGGVVQIFTRAGAQPGAELRADAGQGHTREAGASVTTPLGGALLTVSAGYRAQQAIDSINLAQAPFLDPQADGNWNRHGALRLEDHGPLGDLSAWAWGSRNDTQWLDPFNASATVPADQILQVQHATLDGFGLSGARRFGSSRVSLSAAQSRDDSIDVSNVANSDPYTDADNDAFHSRRRQITLQDTTSLAPGVDWISGLEHVAQDGSFTVFDYGSGRTDLVAAQRRVDSLWTGGVARWGSQQLQLNLRHDRYSDFGAANTGLLGWGWRLAPAWKLTAQASSGFRAPSFEDLYYPHYGNAQLQPEHARSLELGLRWSGGALAASAALFRNRVDDLIQSEGPGGQSINIGRATLQGAELQGGGRWGGLHLDAGLSLDRPRNDDTGQPLLRRASYALKLSAGWTQGRWGASADWQRTGARDDGDLFTFAPVQLAPYNLARVALRCELAGHVQLSLRVENLFNASYQLVDGYNTLPRLVIAGVEAHL